MNKMCCPAYTHRLNVEAFKPSRSQKKVLRRWERYLEGAVGDGIAVCDAEIGGAMMGTEERNEGGLHRRDHRCTQAPYGEAFCVLLGEVIDRWFWINDYDRVEVDVAIRPPSSRLTKLLGPSTFLTSPACFSLFHSLELHQRHKWTSADDVAAQLCRIFEEQKQQIFEATVRHALDDVTLHHKNGHLNFEIGDPNRLEDLNGLSIHGKNSDVEILKTELDMSRTPSLASSDTPSVRSLPTDFSISLSRPRRLEVTWKPSVFDEEEYRLYKKYQMAVHGDHPRYIDRSRYRRCMVDTPLKPHLSTEEMPEWGSFHIQYRIDDRLIGVSVVDVLPRCLSSNYFFWDPDFAPLQLGKISILLEIDWMKSVRMQCPGLEYYYLGHYVHSCPKTNYKTNYAPSELLCPEKHIWVTVSDEVKSRLDAEPYVVLSALPGVECRPNAVMPKTSSTIANQKIQLPGGDCLTFSDYLKVAKCPASDRSKMQKLDQLTAMIDEWRSQTMSVAHQLVYSCQLMTSSCTN